MATTFKDIKLDIADGGLVRLLEIDIDLVAGEIFYIPEEYKGIRVASLRGRRVYASWMQDGGAGTLLFEAEWMDDDGVVLVTQDLTGVDILYPFSERVRFKASETGSVNPATGKANIWLE